MAKTATKKTVNKTKTTKRKSVNNEVAKKSFLQKAKESRSERKIAKKKQKAIDIKKNLADKKAQEIAEIKASQAAIKAKAIEQVEIAVSKKNKRRSRPLATLMMIAIISGLSGALVWQYRDTEIQNKNTEIASLKDSAKSFEASQQASEAAKKAEEAKFKEFKNDTFSMRVPVEWIEIASELPLQEKIIGDDNVTIRIVSSDSRNSVEQFVPSLDYLWQISESNNQIKITDQSLHCERFDTLDNNLKSLVREHNGFKTYCDSSSEKVTIYALATPDKYGAGANNTYFEIEIKDVQQIKLEDIQTYIQSYKAL